MPEPARRRKRVPKFRLHKPTGQAFVELNGKRIYLGKHEKPEARLKYHQLIAEWLEAGRRLPVKPDELTVVELIVRFMEHAQSYYVRADGAPTSEVDNIRQALRPVRKLYGHTQATDFGPKALRTVRAEMIEMGWARTNINKMIGRVKLMFRWAGEHELIPGTVWHGLQTVRGLAYGRGGARESKRVQPVAEADVEAVRPFVSRQVWTMIRLQLLTAARAGEIVRMRPADIDTGGNVWIYRPRAHKTAHHGHERAIYLGPQAQDVLRPFLDRDPEAYCFSPAEAEAERLAQRHADRETPLNWGNRPGTNRVRKRKKPPKDHYTTASYGRAIARACERAFAPPPPLGPKEGEKPSTWKRRLTDEQKAELKAWNASHGWHSHQLRHTAATRLRKEHGIEAARVILGHRSAAITEVYAEIDKERAIDAMLSDG